MASQGIKVKFWGARGSIATPGKSTLKYGGNTACVEVDCGAAGCFIFDAGTGIRLLGDDICANGRGCSRIVILLSHFHWDHIQGLLFFQPLYTPGMTIELWCPEGNGIPLPEVLDSQMRRPFFPIDRSKMLATHSFTATQPGRTEPGGGVTLTACRVRHSGTVLAYRLEYQGRSVVYATDREPDEANARQPLAGELIRLASGADLLIHDAQYTDDEYQELRRGWGHSPYNEALRVAREAGVKRLALFHHDPAYDDRKLTVYERQLKGLAAGDGLDLFFAAEGMKLVL